MKKIKLYKWTFPLNCQLQFNSSLWQKRQYYRRFFAAHIVESRMAIGMTLREVQYHFGPGRNGEYADVISFDIAHNIFTGKKQKLNFYFKDGKVERVALKHRFKIKR